MEGLHTARGAVRLMSLCHVLTEMGPAGRDAVASLAARPGRRGRMALAGLELAMDRGPVRAAIAARLRVLLEDPRLFPRRRRAVARVLMEGGWTSAHPAIRRSAEGDPAWQRSFHYPDRLTAWLSPNLPEHCDELERPLARLILGASGGFAPASAPACSRRHWPAATWPPAELHSNGSAGSPGRRGPAWQAFGRYRGNQEGTVRP